MSQNPYTSGGGAGGGGGPQPGYEAWYDEPRTSSLSVTAVLSLVFSVLCVTAPLGIILGVASLFMIGASRGRKHGKGLAISGIIVGLFFATCLTFAMVGGMGVAQMMQQGAIKPTGDVLRGIEGGDRTMARSGMNQNAAAVITDEQFDAFRDAYQAELGKFVAEPQTLGEWIQGYFNPPKAFETFAKDLQRTGRGDNMIPVVCRFEKGRAVVGIRIARRPDATNRPMVPENLVIVTDKGSVIWLVDPSGGGLPAPPTPPTAPEEPAKPEVPPGSGGGGG